MQDDETTFLEELKQRKVFRVAAAYVVVAWIALQFFDLVLDNVNAPGWVMQSIMAVAAAGFPIALVLAWAFDVSSSGVHKTPGRSRAFVSLVVAVTVGVLGYVGWIFVGSAPGDTELSANDPEPEMRVIDSIAVLPFESFSENEQDEYFADGLADTLLHKLANLSTLKVIARNSSFQFKGSNKDAREIGEILDVVALLEGSVQRQGGQVRVIAQLIDTSDGSHIWSSTFDDAFQNIFELQDRIAQDIMQQLQVSISERDLQLTMRNGTDSPEAYDLLMRAMQTESFNDRKAFDPETDPAIALLDRALEIDPDYVHAMMARASTFSRALFFDTDPETTRQSLAEAQAAANQAVEMSPKYADAHLVLGWVYLRMRDVVQAEESFKRALELDPRLPGAMQGLALLTIRRDPQFALELLQQAQELDPQDPFIYRQQSFAYDALGNIDSVREALQSGIDRFPDSMLLKEDLAGLYIGKLGQPVEAAPLLSKILQKENQSRLGLASMTAVWIAVGDADRSVRWLDLYAANFPSASGVSLYRSALLLDGGAPDEARAVMDATSVTPNFQFDRATALGGVCLVQNDAECMQGQATQIATWLDEYDAIGRTYDFAERYRMAVAVLRNAGLPPGDRDSEELQSLLDGSKDWPLNSGRGNRFTNYLRVMLQSLLEHDQDSGRELLKTLELPDDGFLYKDIFRLSPLQNPLITRLQGIPEYEQWRSAFGGRREQARGRLAQMERDGEILSSSDVAP